MHFAAFAYVGESVDKPLMYYRNNVATTISVLESMQEAGTLKAKLPKSLDQRLKALELTSMDPELQQRAGALREQLR